MRVDKKLFKTLVIIGTLIIGFLFISLKVYAISIYSSFGENGVVSTTTQVERPVGEKVTIQADNKILVGGNTNQNGSY